MDGVSIVPDAAAKIILSQLVSSNLNLAEDVSLCGRDKDYWQFKKFITALGLEKEPFSIKLLNIFRDPAVAATLANMDMVDRAAAIVPEALINVCRIDEQPEGLQPEGNPDECPIPEGH